MKKIIYNKLVRDNIPDIIKSHGKKANVITLNDDIYFIKLKDKLLEEVDEYLESDTIEEIADIYEVIDAILAFKGIDKKDIIDIQNKKVENNGAFKKRYLLQEVIEED